MKTVIVTVLVLAVLGVAGALFVAFSGVANVAADEKAPAVVDWFLGTTSDHAVANRAAAIPVPDLDNSKMVREGYDHYHEMCVGCHGAPGLERSEVARGLNPEAPDLAARDAPGPAEEFWVVKHGIRMTGMPAFGPTHSDDKIWDIVAFLQRLKGMSASDYAAFVHDQSQPAENVGGAHEED